MSQTSPNLDLPLIMPAQAQKHVTVNEALLRLDALTQACAESRSLSVQPAEPADGQAWILPAGASGADWSGFAAQDLAVFRDGAWTAYPPRDGWRVQIRDEGRAVTFDAGRALWLSAATQAVLALGAEGALTQARVIEAVESGLSGSSVTTGLVLPERSIVFAVCVRVRDAVAGATAYDCGLAGETSKFGGWLGVSAGASNIGVIGPTALYADTPVVLTPQGGDFAGGSVALSAHVWVPEPPEA